MAKAAITPSRVLGHIAYMVVGACQQFLRALLIGLAEHRMIQQLRRPAVMVVALVECRLRRSDCLVRVTDFLQVMLC